MIIIEGVAGSTELILRIESPKGLLDTSMNIGCIEMMIDALTEELARLKNEKAR